MGMTRMRLLLAGLALAALAGTAWGAGLTSLSFTSSVSPGAGTAQAEVLLNGVRLLSYRGPGAPMLAQNLAARLTEAALAGVTADAVESRGDERSITITLAGADLITVDKDYAFASGSTLEGLAGVWVGRLKEAFSLPYLSVPVDRLVVPLGEARSLPLVGNFPQPLQVGVDSAVAQVNPAPDNRSLVVTGAAVGSGSVVLRCGQAYLAVPVQVMKWAGRIRAGAAQVTGVLAPPWLLERAARAAAALAVDIEPGAQVAFGPPQVPTAGLPPGGACSALSAVKITGSDYLAVSGQVPVTVRNIPYPVEDAAVLMVSNNPERLRAQGLWYEAPLGPGPGARLLYHHVNDCGQAADLVVELANTSAVPARVRIVEASAGPSRDEMFAGHIATSAYMERQQGGIGYIATIPAQQRYLVAVHRMPPGQVVSGIQDLKLLEGEGLMVRLQLAPPASQPLYGDLSSYRPSQSKQQFIFPNPTKTLEASYTVGGNWAFVTVGRHAISGERDGERLRGNYGVFYDVKFRVANPSDREAKLELGLIAAGGACRGVLLVDGRKYESGVILPAEEQVVAALSVPPRSQQTILVRIMPQSGSNYPAQLFIRRAGYKLSGAS